MNNMRYTVVDTWNGEGYSDSRVIESFDTLNAARYTANSFFQDAYLAQINSGFGNATYEIEINDECLSFFDGTDAGAIHIIDTTDAYGVLIMPDCNEVMVLHSKESFDSAIEVANETLECDEDEFTAEGGAGHTDLGYEIIVKL